MTAGRRYGWGAVALGAIVAVGLTLGAVGVGPATRVSRHPIDAREHGGVVRVYLAPVPEGVAPPPFERRGFVKSEPSYRLSVIEQQIPQPLPAPIYQGVMCRAGGDLVVEFADGDSVSYGPCKRPASIDALVAYMLHAVNSARSYGQSH